jgi:adenylosuccinate synthase
MPLAQYHKVVDGLLEERRAGKSAAIGTTKKGIGPCYTAKATRSTALRVGMLRDWATFEPRLRQAISDHQLMFDFEFDVEAEVERLKEQSSRMRHMVVDGVYWINDAYRQGKKIITEGANAIMLDIDYGTFPYVTSSSTGAAGIGTGLGLSPDKIQTSIGVLKAYTTRVGGGPFPTELTDSRGGGARPDHSFESDIGLQMQTVGAEIGVTTGRKRRCGWFDAVVAQYSNMLNGYASVNVTKLDVLDGLDYLKIGVAYKIRGERLPPGMMPSTLEDLGAVEVEYETLPGWKQPIAKCRSWDDLPSEAQAYIRRIEQLVGVPVSWVGVGPEREAMIQLTK